MTNDPIAAPLRKAASALESAGLRFAVIGGLAASLRATFRITEDVDLVVAAELDDVDEIIGVFRAEDSPLRLAFDEAEELARTAFLLPLVDGDSGVRVDLTIGLTEFERSAVERASVEAIGGVSLPVIQAEDLLVMKLLADRPKDQQDIEGLVFEAGDDFGWDHVLQCAAEFDREAGLSMVERIESLRREFADE